MHRGFAGAVVTASPVSVSGEVWGRARLDPGAPSQSSHGGVGGSGALFSRHRASSRDELVRSQSRERGAPGRRHRTPVEQQMGDGCRDLSSRRAERSRVVATRLTVTEQVCSRREGTSRKVGTPYVCRILELVTDKTLAIYGEVWLPLRPVSL